MNASWTNAVTVLDRIRCLVPCNCLVCSYPMSGPVSLCDPCRQYLPEILYACQRCAIPLNPEEGNALCGKCLLDPPSFDRCFSLFHYAQPVSGLIGDFKFRANFAAGRVLGRLLAQCFDQHYKISQGGDYPDLLLPVPMHPRRLRKRGFNQCQLLAMDIAKSTGLLLRGNVLHKIKDTPAQSELNARERLTNLRGAFALDSPIDPGINRIALIEDVVTTGTTIEAIARLIRGQATSQGEMTIDVWALARANLGARKLMG